MEKINGVRQTYTGIFVRFGRKNRYKPKNVGGHWIDYDETILLQNIKNLSGSRITDHLWFNYTIGFSKLGKLVEGDIIQFDARVGEYVKGYVNNRDYIDDRQLDYKLGYPTKIKKL